ncbi:MAG: class I SAM-dependent methyltransferase [Planctomycetota bacterium]
MTSFGLPAGYHVNLDPDGRPLPSSGPPREAPATNAAAYKYAAKRLRSRRGLSLIDLGCGMGSKLERYIAPVCHDIAGIDVRACIDFCRQRYLFGRWVADDIEAPRRQWDRVFDLILAAGVIEHLADPATLIEYARGLAHKDSVLILATPDRDRIYTPVLQGAAAVPSAPQRSGPPTDPTRVREWTAAELTGYLKTLDLEILEQTWVESARPEGWLARVCGGVGPANTLLIAAKFKKLTVQSPAAAGAANAATTDTAAANAAAVTTPAAK